MEAENSAGADVLSTTFSAVLDLCKRLEQWTTQDESSPLIRLARSQVARLVTEIRLLEDGIIRLYIDNVPMVVTAEYSIHMAHLRSVKYLLSQTLALLYFCTRNERDGQTGSLNALFACTKILGRGAYTNASQPRWNDIVRSVRVTDLLGNLPLLNWSDGDSESDSWAEVSDSELSASDTRSPGISSVSSTEDMSGSQNGGWSFGREYLVDRGADLFVADETMEKLLAQFSPRYVHSYLNSRDAPYRVDSDSLPQSGGFGIVRKVIHNTFNETFAEKTIQNVFSQDQRDEILQEIGILEVCHHRNIIQFVEAYETEDEADTIHIVMAPWAPYTLHQFIHSLDMKRLAKCPWFSPGKSASDFIIFRIMMEMTDAVAYLHSLSIKHKDLKPDNILLHLEGTAEVKPLLTDVGRSKIFTQGVDTDYNKQGAYEFLSLEQLSSTESSLKVDVWQLGCCFAILLAVASGGTAAGGKLWHSFQDTNAKASCNIALEHPTFMPCFANICSSKLAAPGWKTVYSIVTQMLNLDAKERIQIGTVYRKLTELVEEMQ